MMRGEGTNALLSLSLSLSLYLSLPLPDHFLFLLPQALFCRSMDFLGDLCVAPQVVVYYQYYLLLRKRSALFHPEHP